ncbi:MAG: MoaD/ThiS family protein [Acinetobacter sp.]
MIITIEGFGAVQQHLPEHLYYEFSVPTSVSDVLQYVVQQHPQTHTAIERCACAIGEDIVLRDHILQHSCTLVLLSPVAGG